MGSPRRRDRGRVLCVRGTNGGTYAFSIVGSNKLTQVSGDAPREGTVAAGESVTIKARYEAVAASGSEGDIVAKAEFTENGSGQKLSDEHSQLTAVKVEVWPLASREGCPCRHNMGVCEDFSIELYPADIQPSFKLSTGWQRHDYVGNLFACLIKSSLRCVSRGMLAVLTDALPCNWNHILCPWI